MAANEMKANARGRILGNKNRLDVGSAVQRWIAPSAAQVDQLPEQPEAAERGWPVEVSVRPWRPPQEELPWDTAEDSIHAFIFHHLQETSSVLRTMLGAEETGAADGPLAGLTARQMVSAFLHALNEGVRVRLTGYLRHDELVAVVQGIAEDAVPTHQTGMHVLEQVRQRILTGDYLAGSGRGLASQLLERRMGKGRARVILDRTFGTFEPQLDVLDGVSSAALAPFISPEHPQTIALILRQLPAELAAGVISRLPEQVQADVAVRMATSELVSPATLKRVWEGFIDTVRGTESGDPWNQHDLAIARERCVKTVADMLNFAPASSERAVLNHLDAVDSLGDAVRNIMFTFADIIKLSDREMQIVLRQTSKEELVVAFKSAEVALIEKFLSNMSERVRDEVREEMAAIGPMRLSEIEEVQLRIVQKVRQLEEQGEVVIVHGHCGDPFV